jgi:hypothetical protein
MATGVPKAGIMPGAAMSATRTGIEGRGIAARGATKAIGVNAAGGATGTDGRD